MNPTAATKESAHGAPRFVRRTSLRADEYRKNFRQIDADVIAAVTSVEADRVTPLMSKIYLRLVSAPAEFWEREGVLYFTSREADGRMVKSSKVLYELLGVASATAHKALNWMHEEGVIGYFAGKNGAGIRIFLNRASGSIGVRADAAAGKKILQFSRGSNGEAAGSNAEPAFIDSFAVSEGLDPDLNPRAPKNGAEKTRVFKTTPDPRTTSGGNSPRPAGPGERTQAGTSPRVEVPVEEIVARLRLEIEPSLRLAASQAVAQEQERTREWLEKKGLPKAARVAQRETYDVLRKYGVMAGAARAAQAEVGRGCYNSPAQHALADEEVRELAEACVALLETRGQPVEVTLSGMGVDAGGFLLPEDASRVREKVRALL